MKYLVSAGVERRSKFFKLIVCRVHNSWGRDRAACLGVVAFFRWTSTPCFKRVRSRLEDQKKTNRGLKITFKRPKNVDYFCCKYFFSVFCFTVALHLARIGRQTARNLKNRWFPPVYTFVLDRADS